MIFRRHDKYHDFWQWFIDHNELFFNFESNQEKIFDLLADRLHKLDENLTFEFGPIEEGRRKFIVSADGILASFPEVERLYEQKPNLKNWTILKFRPRLGCEYLLTLGDTRLNPQDVYYRMFDDEGKIGILLFIENYEENTDTYQQMAFLLLDSLLGEYDMETKVGGIECQGFTSEYFAGSLPLPMLSEDFDKAWNATHQPQEGRD